MVGGKAGQGCTEGIDTALAVLDSPREGQNVTVVRKQLPSAWLTGRTGFAAEGCGAAFFISLAEQVLLPESRGMYKLMGS